MKYAVQAYTMCQGWINCWHVIDADGNDTLQLFDTEKAAQTELNEFLAEIEQEISDGERPLEHGYDAEDFRIVPVELVEPKAEGKHHV